MMISSGENISWLSKYLGHSNVMTTLKIYARWLADGDPNAGMKAVEKFLIKPNNEAFAIVEKRITKT